MESIDFRQDLRCWVLEELTKYDVQYKEKDSLRVLLVKLYTFLEKYIVPRERAVLVSKELKEKSARLPENVQGALEAMARWVRNGIDINYFQGRGLYGGGSRDYQNMLYGIVHLHLSAKKEDAIPIVKGKFAKPGKYLLFACFRREHAFFIDVVEHPEPLINGQNLPTQWTSAELFRIMARNWPALVEDRKIQGTSMCDAKGNKIELDDNAIAQLTVNHLNTAVEADGALYIPGDGIAGNGASVQAVRNADKMTNETVMAQRCYEHNAAQLHTEIKNALVAWGMPTPQKFDIHFDYVPELERFAIVERNSNVIFDYRNGKLLLT